MNKTINDFTGKFLTYSRVTLFILFALASFNWYSSTETTPGYVTTVLNLIGGICFISWIYAVGHRANERLQKRNINLSVFKYFNFAFIVIIGSVLLMLLFSKDVVDVGKTTGALTYHITYTQPVGLALVFAVALLFVAIVAAKTLVSAEQNKEVEFGDYFTTFLMMAFAWIGLWFIQPRIQKL